MAGNGVFAEILDGEVYKYYSEGEWKKSSSGKTVAIINPTTRKTQYRVQGITKMKISSLPHDFSVCFRSNSEILKFNLEIFIEKMLWVDGNVCELCECLEGN